MTFPVSRVLHDSDSHRHAVQFYQDDAFLNSTVCDYLAAGLRVGQPGLVIATEAHCSAFSNELLLKGFEPELLVASGRLTFLDARDMLSKFMVGGMPDRHRFLEEVGRVVEQASHMGALKLRAYGEMVDVLWREGNGRAAIALEEFWNDAATRHSFMLLCAYAMSGFFKETDGGMFHEICRTHTNVLPDESYGGRTDDQRHREIARLQQRSTALEAEIERRKSLEVRLHDALLAQQDTEDRLRTCQAELEDAISTILQLTAGRPDAAKFDG